jgi:hypothetical protein
MSVNIIVLGIILETKMSNCSGIIFVLLRMRSRWIIS